MSNDPLWIEALQPHDWKLFSKMVSKLIQQLSPGAGEVTESDYFDVLRQDEKNFTVYKIWNRWGPDETPEGEFVGMATLFYRHLLSGWIGEIHDVVVDEKYYRQGYGRKLTQKIFEDTQRRATELGKPIKLMLTSKPKREAANAMYLQAGFKLMSECLKLSSQAEDGGFDLNYAEWGTNLYQKLINP